MPKEVSYSLAAALSANGLVCATQETTRWSPFDRIRKKKRRDAEYFLQIDVSALFGIFLAIFIAFANGNSISHGAGVDLVRSRNATLVPTALRDDAMWISVTRDGKWYFGDRQVALDGLPSKILEALHSGAEKRVFLLVDARAKYKDAEMAVDGIRSARIRRITFLTYQGSAPSSPR